MKKILLSILVIFTGILLVGCVDKIDLEKVEVKINLEQGDTLAAITKNIGLPTKYDDKVIASWVSSNEAIKIDGEIGKVTRALADVSVNLTATFKLGKKTLEKPVVKVVVKGTGTPGVVNKASLLAKITAVEGLKEADYTPATFTPFRAALNVAKDVYDKATATQTEVDSALALLTSTHAALVKTEVPIVGGYDIDILGSIGTYVAGEITPWSGYAKVPTIDILKIKGSDKILPVVRYSTTGNKTKDQVGFESGLVLRSNAVSGGEAAAYIEFSLAEAKKIIFDVSIWASQSGTNIGKLDAIPETAVLQVKKDGIWVNHTDLLPGIVGAPEVTTFTIENDLAGITEFRFYVLDPSTNGRVIISRIVIDGTLNEVTEADKAALNAKIIEAEAAHAILDNTEASRAALRTEITSAEALVANEFASQTNVDAMVLSLQASIDNLKSSIANITTEAELLVALADSDIRTINLLKDIILTNKLALVRGNLLLNGNGFKLDLNLSTPTTWSGDYVLQVWNSVNVVIKDIVLINGNAGLLVNGSTVTLEGTIDVSNNGFGGIEVSKGSGLLNDPKLIISSTAILKSTSETKLLPTVWIDKGVASFLQDDSQTLTGIQNEEQIFYFLDGALAVVDKTVLGAKITGAETAHAILDNTETSRAALRAKITEAEALFSSAVANQESIDAMVISLQDAIDNLQSAIVDVTTEDELVAALANSEIKVINLLNDIILTNKLALVRGNLLLNGNGFKLDLNLSSPATGSDDYVLQVWNSVNVVIKDIVLINGNAGLLVNGSTVTLEGTIDVSSNGFGGIKVSKEAELPNDPLLILPAETTLVNTTETKTTPTVWIDALAHFVEDVANVLFADQVGGQTFFFLDEQYVVVHTDADFIAAAKLALLVQDEAIENFNLPNSIKITLGEVEKEILISWVSGTPAVLTLTDNTTDILATVTRPPATESDVTVTLTASLSLNSETDNKLFDVDVAREELVQATFKEDFSKLGLSGTTYTKTPHTFFGVNDQEWLVTIDARGDEPLDGAALLLRIGDLTTTFKNGLSGISFDYVRAYTGSKPRTFEVFINDVLVQTINVSATSDEVETFILKDLQYNGDVKLVIKGTGAQKLIDNLVWIENI